VVHALSPHYTMERSQRHRCATSARRLGAINLGVLNLWLSVSESKTRTTEVVCVVIYFGLPLAVLGLCTGVRLLARAR
jgi:hypothetical protein